MSTLDVVGPQAKLTRTTIRRIAIVMVHSSPLTELGSPDSGGMTVYVLALARQLASQGVNVDIFSRRFDTETPEIVDIAERIRAVTISAGPPHPIPKNDLFCHLGDFTSEMATFALRNGLRYDIVHTHYWLSGWVGHLLKQYWDVPVLHMYHTLAHLKNAVTSNGNGEVGLRLQIERELLRLVDYVVTPNPDERAELVWGLGARNSKIAMIPPGIDLELFHPADSSRARSELGLPSRPIVLFVGRIDPIKDLDTLFKAFAELQRTWDPETPSPILLIIGGMVCTSTEEIVLSPELQLLKQRAIELGIEDNVILRGSQPQELLPKYYAASTVLAMPSLYESFGLVVVEAMACGLPVVATRVGGMKFTVEEGRSGLLVPRQDYVAMSEALGRIIEDRDLRSTLQIGARQAAIRFSWSTIGSAMLALSEKLVAENVSRSALVGAARFGAA